MNIFNSRTKHQRNGRKLSATLLLAGGVIASIFAAQSAYAVLGQCKDTEIKFVNSTGLTITIPREGHKVKNPGGLEGWNNMTTGGSVNDLASGKSTSVSQTLNIKCVNDAEFEIHYSSKAGRDFTQVFTKQNIEDKYATLTLTHN